MAATNFNQSGIELRIQDEATVNPGNEVPGFHRSLFWARKLPPGLEGLGSVSQTRPIRQLRINLYTCHSNVIQLYLLKTPNSLQEGPVFTSLVEGHPYTVSKQDAC